MKFQADKNQFASSDVKGHEEYKQVPQKRTLTNFYKSLRHRTIYQEKVHMQLDFTLTQKACQNGFAI